MKSFLVDMLNRNFQEMPTLKTCLRELCCVEMRRYYSDHRPARGCRHFVPQKSDDGYRDIHIFWEIVAFSLVQIFWSLLSASKGILEE